MDVYDGYGSSFADEDYNEGLDEIMLLMMLKQLKYILETHWKVFVNILLLRLFEKSIYIFFLAYVLVIVFAYGGFNFYCCWFKYVDKFDS